MHIKNQGKALFGTFMYYRDILRLGDIGNRETGQGNKKPIRFKEEEITGFF